VVSWSSSISTSTNALKAMTYAPGAGFSAPGVVNDFSAGHFVGIESGGRAVIVYQSPSEWPPVIDGILNVYGRELAAGASTWSAAALLETGAGDVIIPIPPACAMNASGQAVCAWVQNDIANSTVRNSLWANVRQ
jgi:hypothetical protein